MISITRPQFIVLDKNKLHMSRKPGCIAWLLLGFSTVIFTWIFSCLTNNIYLLIILSLGEVMFGLDNFGKWENLILFKEENKAIVEKYIWSDKLCSGCSGKFSMRLTDIQYVGISTEIDLFILHRNGKMIIFNMKGLTQKEIQNFKREINYFLNMSRLKYLDHFLVNPSDRLLLVCESEENYLQKIPRACLPRSNELTVSDNELRRSKTYCQIQQNLSFPNVVQFNDYRPAILRNFYTEHSTYLDRVKYMRNIYAALVSRNLLKHDKEHD